MNTVKHKMKNIMKKMISVVITLAMLVQYLPVNGYKMYSQRVDQKQYHLLSYKQEQT